MADIQHVHIFKADVNDGLIHWPGGIIIGLGDSAADVFRLTLTKGGTACADIESAIGYFVRPDGTTVDIEGTISTNTISITLREECYEYPGHFTLTICAGCTAGEDAVDVSLIQIEGRVLITRTSHQADPGSIWDIDSLWTALDGKISEPSSDGTSGQALLTDGNGGRYWGSAASSGATSQLIIGGTTYTLREGSSGAAGYITIETES